MAQRLAYPSCARNIHRYDCGLPQRVGFTPLSRIWLTIPQILINLSIINKMPTSFALTYLLPAIVLNPLVVLHSLNTFASHFIPSAMAIAVSRSPHKCFEVLGPPGNHDPYLDIHASDQLCWSYTAVMVVLQVLAYRRVSDNRELRRNISAARKAERERLLRSAEGTEKEGLTPTLTTCGKPSCLDNAHQNAVKERKKHPTGSCETAPLVFISNRMARVGCDSDEDEDITDTSEEETIV